MRKYIEYNNLVDIVEYNNILTHSTEYSISDHSLYTEFEKLGHFYIIDRIRFHDIVANSFKELNPTSEELYNAINRN